MAEFYIFNNGLMTPNTMSGCDQRALNWGRIFSERGHRVNIFTSVFGAERFVALGLNVYITGSAYLRSNIGLLLVYIWRAIKSCFIQRKIIFSPASVIYSSSDLLADAVPAIYMKLRHPGFKMVVGMHLIAPNPFKGFKKSYVRGLVIPTLSSLYYFAFQRMVLCILKRLSALVLVSNKEDRLFLIKKGFNPSGVLVTYGAFDASCVKKATVDEKTYEAIYIGRFHVQKGFPDLLKAWKIVVARLPQATLIVLGEDITAPDIKAFIKENGLEENIRFLGYIGGEEKYRYLKSSKVLIFPSYYESFGMVALEAMSCSVPVVAYDLPVLREIYTKGMLRVPIGDIEGMAQNVISLITDEDKRRIVSQEALELSGQFTWDKTAQGILDKIGL